MNRKLIKTFLIPILIATLISALVCGCDNKKKSYQSFDEAYRQGTVDEQIIFALENDLFKKIGFVPEAFTGGDWGQKYIDDDYEVIYYFSNSKKCLQGYITAQINEFKLTVVISTNIRVNLTGDGFSYICYLNKEDFALKDEIEYAKDFYEIFQRITLDTVKSQINTYNQKTLLFLEALHKSIY